MAGCIFPWSIFFVFSLFSLPQYLKQKDNHFYAFLACWILAVLVIFQSAHSKLVSYIFPLFAGLALFTGNFITELISQKKRLIYFILSLNLLTVFLIPAALIIISIWFKHYLSLYFLTPPVINFIIFVFLAFGLSLSFLIARKKLLKSVYCLALFVPIMVYLIPFVRYNIDPYLSPKESCQYLLKNYKVDNIILSSKFFARGVRYYTDKEVAVIDIPGTPFFSQHPIPFLNSKAKVLDFLRKQKVTYCVLKNSSVEDIRRVTSGEFKYTVLKVIGNEYILKIETL
jgi:hypothetical protein